MVLTILIFVCQNRLTSHTELSSSCEMNVAQESVTCVVSVLVSHWSVFIWSNFCVPVIVSDEFAFFFSFCPVLLFLLLTLFFKLSIHLEG